MEDLNNIALGALDRYFAVLEKVGYISNSETNKLLLLQFLQEFLQEYSYYITEEDYNIIDKLLQCLSSGSCLIPYRDYKEISAPATGYVLSIPIKITEDTKVRITEEEVGLRLINQ